MTKEKAYNDNNLRDVIIFNKGKKNNKNHDKKDNSNRNKIKKPIEAKSRLEKLNELIDTVLADFEKFKNEKLNKIDNPVVRKLAKNSLTGLFVPTNFELKRHYFNKGRGSSLKHQIYQLVENIRVIEKRNLMPYVKKQLPGFF